MRKDTALFTCKRKTSFESPLQKSFFSRIIFCFLIFQKKKKESAYILTDLAPPKRRFDAFNPKSTLCLNNRGVHLFCKDKPD